MTSCVLEQPCWCVLLTCWAVAHVAHTVLYSNYCMEEVGGVWLASGLIPTGEWGEHIFRFQKMHKDPIIRPNVINQINTNCLFFLHFIHVIHSFTIFFWLLWNFLTEHFGLVNLHMTKVSSLGNLWLMVFMGRVQVKIKKKNVAKISCPVKSEEDGRGKRSYRVYVCVCVWEDTTWASF